MEEKVGKGRTCTQSGACVCQARARSFTHLHLSIKAKPYFTDREAEAWRGPVLRLRSHDPGVMGWTQNLSFLIPKSL